MAPWGMLTPTTTPPPGWVPSGVMGPGVAGPRTPACSHTAGSGSRVTQARGGTLPGAFLLNRVQL